ncbi:MAG TPA: MoaD/ThiS family protein [Streptosporangiaceae bacterium]|nr:MoaD/ThiS family protein [Streptosporangiaceae bacterium]
MTIVTLRYWAAAKEAAGVAEEKVEAENLAEALAAGLAAAAARLPAGGSAGSGGDRLRLVMARSSFLVDGQPATTRPPGSVRLDDGAMVEVLPPFAGG